MREPLPIDALLPEIVAALRTNPALVLSAAPGAGKTTRVPPALLAAGLAGSGEILVVEPRRLAARLAAGRVAAELGEAVGATVGYTVRFENVGRDSRIRFVTEGILARRLIDDSELAGVAAVVIDEFHERHLATDLALGCVRRLQLSSRPDLKLVVMSATLDAAPLVRYLAGAPTIESDTARFEVAIEYDARPDSRPLEARITSAVRSLVSSGLDGHVLVFLPGAAEIRRAFEALRPIAVGAGLRLLTLHGEQPAAEQAGAVSDDPEDRRHRVILATNVAESSVTVPGVAAVIDSGLVRRAGHSVWSGLPELQTVKTSRASAAQRAGRAGRTRAGRVVRLYTRHDFDSRPERDLPEIARADLAETLLVLHGAGVGEVAGLPWFEPPPPAAVEAAQTLLARLGALEPGGGLTATGRSMLRFPVHPRLARLVVEGEKAGIGVDACAVAALLGERDIRLDARPRFAGAAQAGTATGTGGSSDVLRLLEALRDAGDSRGAGLDPQGLQTVRRAEQQLVRLLDRGGRDSQQRELDEESLRIAILAGFPDRVARRRGRTSREFVLSTGGAAELSRSSVVHDAPLIIAVDAEVRPDNRAASGARTALIRLASAIEPEWLAALFPAEIGATAELVWNSAAARVDEVRRTLYGQLALEEETRPAPVSEAAARLLAAAARDRGLADFRDAPDLAGLRARLEIAAAAFPELTIPALDEATLASALEDACAGKRALAELGGVSLAAIVLDRLPAPVRRLLARELPATVDLAGRRNVPVHYDATAGPWIESRLQDFFGMSRGPAVCAGRLPVTLHLLAPNARAVQVTRDLSGFWERHYPAIRRELARRYPRHKWPEKP